MDNYNIIHLAHTKDEKKILHNSYNIDKIICLEEEIKKIFDADEFNKININEIEDDISIYTDKRFKINSSIQNDRTCRYFSYMDSVKLIKIYYHFWSKIIKDYKIDFIFHEPTSLFMNHIASILCKKYGATYVSPIQVYGVSKYNFAFATFDNGNILHIDEKEIKVNNSKIFIENFRKDFSNIFDFYYDKSTNIFKKITSTLAFTSKFIIKSIINIFLIYRLENKLINHIENYRLKSSVKFSKVLNFIYYEYIIKYHPFDKKVKYYFYPLHVEPESVVLYWADGYYENQTKLILNIAANLPPNHYLYVKDHPHAGAYRDYIDYLRISEVPNIKIINPKISGKNLINFSQGVFTLNGTAGFEGILMKKPVFTFGNTFYNSFKYVNKVKNIKDLGNYNFKNQVKFDLNYEIELESFIDKYLSNVYEGFTDYFIDYPKLAGIDEESNAIIVSKQFKKFLKIYD